jgi:tight adherence protein C
MALVTALIFSTAVFFLVMSAFEEKERLFLHSRASSAGHKDRSPFGGLPGKVLRPAAAVNLWLPVRPYLAYLERKLSNARQEDAYTPAEYMALQELWFFGVFLAYFTLIEDAGFLCFAAAAAGSFLPLLSLKEKKDKYEREIARDLPYAIDIITVCVEAGLSFDSALAKYVSCGKISRLKDVFAGILADIRLGKSRKEALKDAAKRVRVPEFNSFISSVVQAVELGTAVAGTLRIQAVQLRIKRTQRAEKLAMQAPVKLLLPLIIFIFPVIFLLLFGPLALRMLKGF